MTASIKQGINQTLEVTFDLPQGSPPVERIEFEFSQTAEQTCPVVKRAEYPEDVEREGDVYLVSWTAAETYDFRPDAILFMDTRITLEETDDQPITEIVPILMENTLFEREEVVPR